MVRIPDDLRTQWDSKWKGNRFHDIYEVEAVGPLLVLANFGVDLVDCLWLHFVDNSGALSSLVRGGSSVESGDHIVGVGCMPWFDRVDSASNPTDGLSRERLQGSWTLDQSNSRVPCGTNAWWSLLQTIKCLPMAAGHQEVDTTAWPPALTPVCGALSEADTYD